MRTALVLLGLIWLGSGSATAATEDPKIIKADQLVSLLNVRGTFDGILLKTERMLIQELHENQAAIADTASFERCREQVHRVIGQELEWAKVKGEVVSADADTFEETELTDAITFFQSAAGRKFVAKASELSSKTLQAMQPLITGLSTRVLAISTECNRPEAAEHGNDKARRTEHAADTN